MSSLDEDRLLRQLYAAFNARDMDAVLDAMTDDVDWPNAWEGGRLRGKDAVRDYWSRQWAEIDPRVEPAAIATLPDGRVAVEVDQTVRDHSGSLLGSGRVRHVYTLVDGLVARMDVEAAVARVLDERSRSKEEEMDDRTQRVASLLHEAGEVHHVVYRITDGADDDWASFYAHWLTRHSELGDVLGSVPVRSHLVHELVDCERAYADAGPDEPWDRWYARRVVDRFGRA